MKFLDTLPAEVGPDDPTGPFAAFRVGNARRALQLLRDACRGNVAVTVGRPRGPNVSTVLWAVDDASGRLHFHVESAQAVPPTLVGSGQAWAACYIEGGAKLQFELRQCLWRLDATPVSLRCEFPQTMLLLPRRTHKRVRAARERSPKLRFEHPAVPGLLVELPAFDISPGGCSLWRTNDLPGMTPGMTMNKVEVELDDSHVFFCDMAVQYSALIPDRSDGVRVGCTWKDLAPPAERTLRGWLAGGWRQTDLIRLDLEPDPWS